MAIFSIYVINKAGGLIYQHDHNAARPEVEKTFSYPLELQLKVFDDKIVVAFGERDGIKGNYVLMIVRPLSRTTSTTIIMMQTLKSCTVECYNTILITVLS